MNKNQKKHLYESIMTQVAKTVKKALLEANNTNIYPIDPIDPNKASWKYLNTESEITYKVNIDLTNIAPAKDWITAGYSGNFILPITLVYHLGEGSYYKNSYGEYFYDEPVDDEDLLASLNEYIDEGPLTDLTNAVI